MGEEFMFGGCDVLIIYDDLFKQVDVYCELFLILCWFFGCEVYLGDIFYIYLWLLEWVVWFFDDFGGGLMIVLLVIQIQVGDVFVYILINVIFIIDGQIFLDVDFFYVG